MSETQTSPVEAVSAQAASPEAPNEEQVKTEPTKEGSPKEEAKAEPKQEEKKEEKQPDKFAPKFAALSRKEKELRQREKEMQERLSKQEAELQTRLKQIEEQEKKAQERARLKKEKPVQWLEEEGLTYDQITQAILNNGETTKEQKIEQLIAAQAEEVKRLQAKLEEREKREQEAKEKEEQDQAQKKHDEVINNFKGEIKTLLESSTDEYELLMNNPLGEDPTEAVFATIEAYYEEHKAVLSPKEAADMCERFLEERAEKIANTKKMKAKLSPQQPKQEESKQESAQSQSPKTLENAHSSTPPNRQARKLTDDERLAQAASLVRWNN